MHDRELQILKKILSEAVQEAGIAILKKLGRRKRRKRRKCRQTKGVCMKAAWNRAQLAKIEAEEEAMRRRCTGNLAVKVHELEVKVGELQMEIMRLAVENKELRERG